MGTPPVPAQPRVRAVQARRPDAGAAPRHGCGPARRRLEPDEQCRPSRVHPHEPAARRGRPRPRRTLAPDAPKRTLFNGPSILPSQGVEPGTEPLLYAATSPGAISGGYYGPSQWLGLPGPTAAIRVPRRARTAGAAA